MDKNNFYFDRLVTDVDVNKILSDVELHFRRVIIDTIGTGVITASQVTQNSPSADLTVDVPVLTSYSPNGIRIFTTAISNVLITGVVGSVTGKDGFSVVNVNGTASIPTSGSGTAIVLPTAGNEAYVTLFLYADIFKSNPVLDGLGSTVQFNFQDSFKFRLIRGSDAATGTAVKPTDPLDGGLILADILLKPAMVSILNTDISTTRKKVFVKAIP